MVELWTFEMSSTFHSLRDAPRRRILRELASCERTAGQFAGPLAISLAAAAKHIEVLKKARLIRRERYCCTDLRRPAPGPLGSAHPGLNFYERFWTDRLDVFERRLREKDAGKSPTPKGDDQ